ncbi:MAG TPA: ATP-binding protein, partial [Tepidisphaeraceae bacterium]|nr:ATP-binding protein [Tepidisphaeraceae bacterium]
GKKLKARGIDLAKARASGQFVALDADQMLARFMVNGMPDGQLFMRVIGRVVKQALAGYRRVRAFGEMVAILWQQGNKAAAIRLEELWNELARAHSFALFCAYPMRAFARAGELDPLGEVCTCHTRVIPAESYASLSSPDDRLRAIALLQHKAQSLAAEIEHRKGVEEELRQAKAAAEEANRAKDQFLAVLGHELRTPLTPVLMTTAMLESEPGLPPRMRDDLAMIRRNIALETQLIDDLLDLSRVVNGKMVLHKRDLDVHPLVRNVVEMVDADARAKLIHVELELRAERDRVHADSARLHQVIWNLLKNAIKFTPENGRIIIRTGNDERGWLKIEVRDTGIGIDPQALPKIFNAFEQGGQGMARKFGGLGLGLAISKTVVDLHEGTICAHSEGKGHGACFTVGLATMVWVHERVQVADPSVPVVNGDRPLRILLVDDHADTLKVLRRILESSGHCVTPATSVQEASRAAEADGFDLLISDIGLPDGTGLDVMRSVHARHPGLPAIAMTGFGMEQDIRNSEEAGFSTHLTKPVDIASLEAAVRALTSA